MFVHHFDPVLIDLYIFELRWYSLAYIFGILVGWMYAKKIIKHLKKHVYRCEFVIALSYKIRQ